MHSLFPRAMLALFLPLLNSTTSCNQGSKDNNLAALLLLMSQGHITSQNSSLIPLPRGGTYGPTRQVNDPTSEYLTLLYGQPDHGGKLQYGAESIPAIVGFSPTGMSFTATTVAWTYASNGLVDTLDDGSRHDDYSYNSSGYIGDVNTVCPNISGAYSQITFSYGSSNRMIKISTNYPANCLGAGSPPTDTTIDMMTLGYISSSDHWNTRLSTLGTTTATYTKDADGKITGVTFACSNVGGTCLYGEGTRDLTYTYDSGGIITQSDCITTAGSNQCSGTSTYTETYTYNSTGQMTDVTNDIGANLSGTITYDSGGNLDTATNKGTTYTFTN